MGSKSSFSLSFFHSLRLFYLGIKGTLLSLFGIFLLFLSLFPSLREKVLFFIQTHPRALFLLSLLFIAAGSLFLLKLFLKGKERVFFVKKTLYSSVLEKEALYDLLNLTFKKEHIHNVTSFKVEVKKEELAITLFLKKMPYSEQKTMFSHLEKIIEKALKEQLGFEGTLSLSASFEENKGTI